MSSSVLGSYTLLHRAATLPLPSKFSRRARSTAAVTAVSLPPRVPPPVISRRQSSRAPLLVCRATENKMAFDIHPNALMNRGTEKFDDNWSVIEDKDLIILKLNVGETSTDKLEIAIKEDPQARLVIRYKQAGDNKDTSLASNLNVNLLIPPGYNSKKVTASMTNGLLMINIPKAKQETSTIRITADASVPASGSGTGTGTGTGNASASG